MKLTQTEYALMLLFMRNPGKALSREELLTEVWGADFRGDEKVVDVNIRRLRVKLETDSTSPEFLHTVWGFGYQWDA
jgi:DNA-binding response OmpR family regulator